MSIFDFFTKTSAKEQTLDLSWLKTDMHSHLIPGIDDGSKSLEESIHLISRLKSYGINKIITTPHVMTEFYRNNPENIHEGLDKLKIGLQEAGIDIAISAAAEYFMDEFFLEKVSNGEKLLTMGDQYILIETGFLSKPPMLLESIFNLEMQGYKPILAHPERYFYLHQDTELLDALIERNIYFQINLLSFTGYYSKPVKKFAEALVDRELVALLGTDCHNDKYLDALESLPNSKYFQKLQTLPLLNQTL
ncbi:tyrosine-protein phosphatase [Pararhodonellum marinum]|uniref:tyrosine-protein phosphatase n=1 Tax=Pararhodonellum marinum TaxID=2755358 RepID=UPI00188FC01D|nr:CpsB/CapC family capsule biosynthesis tyrosine phosphatase [Pararhodonellum marinum]